ncbi:hypothetical protein PsYK624_010250 [Phanerochaete sordida]|uniref:Uncharacterized protein n=1 Tax=Phanerochaete sordida TaxID=48140 RepID=A0A9P3FZE7_9APHY|nr:hypothetical protein PsYK624_010250 [Phanerochaete sordida]
MSQAVGVRIAVNIAPSPGGYISRDRVSQTDRLSCPMSPGLATLQRRPVADVGASSRFGKSLRPQ